MPLVTVQETGEVDQNGNVTPLGETNGVKKECQAKPAKGTTKCGYFAFFQGTSMATPHAVGVAALAVSAHGRQGHGGFGMSPNEVRDLVMGSATNHACPAGGTQAYIREGRDATWTAECEGSWTSTGSTVTVSSTRSASCGSDEPVHKPQHDGRPGSSGRPSAFWSLGVSGGSRGGPAGTAR